MTDAVTQLCDKLCAETDRYKMQPCVNELS